LRVSDKEYQRNIAYQISNGLEGFEEEKDIYWKLVKLLDENKLKINPINYRKF
jgi:hypothetical protein